MANDTDLHSLVSWQSGPKTRGGYSIIFSCVALIVTCTWTSLHLNVPGVHDTARTQFFRKIKWMMIMIIFPEFVFSRAVVEFKVALYDYRLMWWREKRLLQLGWCMHQNRGVAWASLMIRKLLRAEQSNSGANPDSWSAYELALPRDRPTTADGGQDLEPVPIVPQSDCKVHNTCIWTLTHSFFVNMGGLIMKLNGEDFLCTTSDLDPAHKDGKQNMARFHFTEAEILDKSKGDTFVRLLWLLQILRLLLDLAARKRIGLPISPFEIVTASFAALSFFTVLLLLKKPLDIRIPIRIQNSEISRDFISLPEWESFMNAYFYREFGLDAGQFRRRSNDSYHFEGTLLLCTLVISTIAFGLVHCAAWNYAFPSVVEKWIWRASALSGIGMPIVALIFAMQLSFLNGYFWGYVMQTVPGRSNRTPMTEEECMRRIQEKMGCFNAWKAMGLISLSLHLASRIALFVIALMSFRAAPRGIYLDTWAAFIPTLQ